MAVRDRDVRSSLVAVPIDARGSLGRAESVVDMGTGCFPDGFAFDEDGGIWVRFLERAFNN